MFIGLWPGNKVLFFQGSPGAINSDSSLGMKFWFYRTVKGDVVFSGQRLDAPALPMPEVVLRGNEDGYGETGFHPAGLGFPSEGCWEVTATIGVDHRMTFVTLVAKVPFDWPTGWPAGLPEGIRLIDSDLTGLPKSFGYIFGFYDGREGNVTVEIIQGLQEKPLPEADLQPVSVNGGPGVCIQGLWDEQNQYLADVDAATLAWSEADFSYRINQTGLGLLCTDLVRIGRASH